MMLFWGGVSQHWKSWLTLCTCSQVFEFTSITSKWDMNAHPKVTTWLTNDTGIWSVWFALLNHRAFFSFSFLDSSKLNKLWMYSLHQCWQILVVSYENSDKQKQNVNLFSFLVSLYHSDNENAYAWSTQRSHMVSAYTYLIKKFTFACFLPPDDIRKKTNQKLRVRWSSVYIGWFRVIWQRSKRAGLSLSESWDRIYRCLILGGGCSVYVCDMVATADWLHIGQPAPHCAFTFQLLVSNSYQQLYCQFYMKLMKIQTYFSPQLRSSSCHPNFYVFALKCAPPLYTKTHTCLSTCITTCEHAHNENQ